MLRATLVVIAAGVVLAACKPASQPMSATAPAAAPADASAITELMKQDVMVGTGPAIAAGQTAVVHYTGWLYDSAAPDHKGAKFDSSRDHGQPFSFPVGAGRVIAGWDQGVVGMQVGGQRTLIIPASLGYGADGGGPIPPNATLLFDIELVGIQ